MTPTRRRPPEPPRHPLEALLDRLDGVAAEPDPLGPIATGFPSIDHRLGGGLRPEDLVVLGGDVGSGKSALALGIAAQAARLGAAVLFLSGEQGVPRLHERLLARQSGVALAKLRTGGLDDEARAAVGAAALGLRRLPLVLQPLGALAPEALDEALNVVPRPRLLVVDALPQLAANAAGHAPQDERTATAIHALKRVALARGVAVLVTAPLPHFRADRPDTRPTLDDFGALGSVRQTADVVLGLFREEQYRPDGGVRGAAELLVLKQRDGQTGMVDLYFEAAALRFEDLLDGTG